MFALKFNRSSHKVSFLTRLVHTAVDLSTLRVIRMPSLSPTMKSAKLLKLYLSEGQAIKSYDLGFEVLATGLTKQSGSNETGMEIEIIEDMFVAKLLCIPGEILDIDSPIALLCENREDIDKLKDLRSLGGIHSAIWQAYVKNKSDISCGC